MTTDLLCCWDDLGSIVAADISYWRVNREGRSTVTAGQLWQQFNSGDMSTNRSWQQVSGEGGSMLMEGR